MRKYRWTEPRSLTAGSQMLLLAGWVVISFFIAGRYFRFSEG
jgi:hypothetical protein